MRIRLRAFASVGVVVAALAAAPARADLLARRVVLEEQAGAAEIATAADGYGGVYHAFISADRTKVLVTVSRDDGLDYGPNVPVGSPPGPGRTLRNVRICAAGDAGMADRTDVYVVWEKTGEPGQGGEVYVNVSRDRGQSWLADPLPLSLPVDSIHQPRDPELACSAAGTAGVVFSDDVHGLDDIFANVSLDHGASWQIPRRIDTGSPEGSTVSRHPHVALDAAYHLVAVWEETRPLGIYSEIRGNATWDGGRTWLPTSALVHPQMPPLYASDLAPRVALGGGGVAYAAWTMTAGPGDGSVFVNASRDGGASWAWPEVVNVLPGDVKSPSIAVARPAVAATNAEWVHLLWLGPGGFPLAGIRYNAGLWNAQGGWTFLHPLEELRLDGTPSIASRSWDPRLALGDPDHVFAAYNGSRPDDSLYNMLAVSPSGGRAWFDEVYPGDGSGLPQSRTATPPSLAGDPAGRAFVGWGVSGTTQPPRVEADATIAETPLAPADPQRNAVHLAAASGAGVHVHVAWDEEVAGSDPPASNVYAAVSHDEAGWWPDAPVLLSAGTGWHRDEEPALATAGADRVFAAWRTQSNLTPGSRIDFARSLDSGRSWSMPVAIDRPPAGSAALHAQLCATETGHVYAVWDDDRGAGRRVFFTRSLDGGATWPLTDVRLSGSGPAERPRIACAADGGVYVVWTDARLGPGQIFAAVSPDFGASWSEVRVSAGPGPAAEPRVACGRRGCLHVVWSDSDPLGGSTMTEVFTRAACGYGTIWDPVLKLDADDPPGAHTAGTPVVASDGQGRVLAAWIDGRASGSVHGNVSLDGGQSWLPASMVLDRNTEGGAARDLYVADGADGRAVAAWSDRSPAPIGSSAVLVNTSRLFGTPGSWLGVQRLNLNDQESEASAAAATMSRDGIAVAWRSRQASAWAGRPVVNRWRVLSGLPGEVRGLAWEGKTLLTWEPVDLVEHYHVYGGDISVLPGSTGDCLGQASTTEFVDPGAPAPGNGEFFLVTAWNIVGEGPMGEGRIPTDPCP